MLDLKDVTSFTDYFVLCSVSNARQGHAICDEIEKNLKEAGERPSSIEGYDAGEWILMDYVDFVVHIFLNDRRAYYDIERLRKSARHLDVNDLKTALTKKVLAVRKKSPVKAGATITKSSANSAVQKKSAGGKIVKSAAKRAVKKTAVDRKK